MLALFIQNHLTRFSIDFPTEGPVGKKANPVLWYLQVTYSAPPVNVNGTWKRDIDV